MTFMHAGGKQGGVVHTVTHRRVDGESDIGSCRWCAWSAANSLLGWEPGIESARLECHSSTGQDPDKCPSVGAPPRLENDNLNILKTPLKRVNALSAQVPRKPAFVPQQ